jgi:hypothetical protein
MSRQLNEKPYREENNSRSNTEIQLAKKRAKRGVRESPPGARSSPDAILCAVLCGLGFDSALIVHFLAVKLFAVDHQPSPSVT